MVIRKVEEKGGAGSQQDCSVWVKMQEITED